ncbi:hypothetical protein LXL04_037113 [Taraxacum kok-saghyz]
MGNHVSNGSGKVILPDGTVQEITEPVTVAELMLEHPQQVVVEVQGGRPKPLGADMKVESKKVYMMLPMMRGKAGGAMSSEETQRLLLRANAVLKSDSFVGAYTGFLPLFARMCPAAVIKSKKRDDEKKARPGLLEEMESEAGRADLYLSRQLSGKGTWKPSLDTIKEKGVKAQIRHWLR